ncbi:serine hydrolase domain-containing protein [Steroidobacter sp.]|uniref:serine hydrolase domain-containing protein n=1 Tax=Steroidobacter sp. TaxID=1978227 RepID=UPI001A4319C9|nr:serine hydrolase domain-containing protein [Steroidobacter sp.]MBL8268794.1 beta-lactamase family protein [Steroidobacter sp.]
MGAWLAGAASADSFDAVRLQIEQARVEQGIPSLAVAVTRRGKIVWEEGFGWADREHQVRATQHTMYSIASISKPITTTALMALVQAGKIDLEGPVNDYLGAAKLRARVGDARDATVRRVANHTSGLPMHVQFFFADEPERAPSRDETILRYGQLLMLPGERHNYSNLGYGVLDAVITHVSGMPYADFVRQEVFVKLGMTHSSVGIEPRLASYQAIRYDTSGAPLPDYDFDHPGASAVYASAHDLARFAMFHLKDHLADQRAILSDASIDEMQRATTNTSKFGPGYGYGVGWSTQERADGYRVVMHTGSMPGVSASLSFVPTEDVALVLLSNSRASLEPIREAIMKKLLPRWNTPPKPAPQPPIAFTATPELSGQWRGTLQTYAGELPLELEIRPDGDVHLRLAQQPAVLLNEVSFKDGLLVGKAQGDLGIADANRHRSYALYFELKLRGDVLNGAVAAVDLGPRTLALAQWAEVRRVNSE